MRRYTVRIDGTDHTIDVEEVTADTFAVHVGERVLEVRLTDHQDLAQALITPTLPVGASRPSGPAAHSTGTATGSVAPPGPAHSGPSRAGRDTMTAPMPGVVLSVAVEPGRRVSRGQTVLVLEAMKMHNDLKAPRDGVIDAVLVSPGDQVTFGAPLITFETGRT